MSNLRQLQDFWFKARAAAAAVLLLVCLQAVTLRRARAQEAKRLGFVARSALKLQARAGSRLAASRLC